MAQILMLSRICTHFSPDILHNLKRVLLWCIVVIPSMTFSVWSLILFLFILFSNWIKMADIDLSSFFSFVFLFFKEKLDSMLLCLPSLFLLTMYGFQQVESNCVRAKNPCFGSHFDLVWEYIKKKKIPKAIVISLHTITTLIWSGSYKE